LFGALLASSGCGRTGLLLPDPAGASTPSGEDTSDRPLTRDPTGRDREPNEPGVAGRPGLLDMPDRPVPVQRDDCTDASSLYIYVVTSDRDVYRFDPEGAAFRLIGNVGCTPSSAFSMAVDRTGTAFVLLQGDVADPSGNPTGTLLRVSMRDASCEVVSEYEPRQRGFGMFGMGFATLGGGPEEALYVGGAGHLDSVRGLATIDTSSFELSYIGTNDPPIEAIELTGTGDGRLFGYLSYSRADPPDVLAEIDKDTGQVLSETVLTGVPGGDAWAVSFWGGDFYFFTDPSGESQVTRYRPRDETYTVVATLPGERIVGAGASTCAPR
jgi:hypothetical protein